MTWRTYNESMNPGRTPAPTASRTLASLRMTTCVPGGHAATETPRRSATPTSRYRCRRASARRSTTRAWRTTRSATRPSARYSNRTVGGGQWDTALMMQSTRYAVPAGYDVDQLGTDLTTGQHRQPQLRHPRPVRRHARHHGEGDDARAARRAPPATAPAGEQRAATAALPIITRAATTTSTTWSRSGIP